MKCQNVLIYKEGADQAAALCQELRNRGYDVSYYQLGAVQTEPDLMVLCPDLSGLELLYDGEIGTGHDFDRMELLLSEKLFEMKDCIDSVAPLMQEGGKRIAFLTKEESSISLCSDSEQFSEHILLSAENMLAKMTFNRLRPLGFTVRCFAPSTGVTAMQYFLQDFCYDPKEPTVHSEENRLVLRNGQFVELPW